MAAVRDIYNFMDKIAPFHIQEDFDNAGFLVGRGESAPSAPTLWPDSR